MRHVDFGRTGLRVSQFALGTGMLGARRDRSIDRDEARSVLTGYVAAGGNLIDVSDAYQGGQSEEMIGSFLSEQREDLVIASKYSRTTSRDASPARTGNHRKAMVQSVEGSLKRLQTDRVDVYFAHYDDGVTPIEEIMRGFDDLVSAGKILYAGLSNFSAWRSAQAATTALLHGWTPLAVLEVEYSLLQRATEREILPFAQAFGLGVLGYSPLAAGVLASKNAISNPGAPSRMGIPTEGNTAEVVDLLNRIALEVDSEPAHVALAWINAKGVIPILGVRDSTHMASNLRAAHTVLTAEHLKHLDNASAIPLGYPRALQEAFKR
jgi:aryl-alcohol dehydrogenase-like predicted oxidoreductase